MDRETNQQENPSLLLPNNNNNNEESPRKPYGGGGGDRLKRDEWSEGAVSTLLEAYEAKWILRNRAKLKGQDWEDVARFVSSRANCTKSPKTQTQCKNKIESMKKRYRSESATNDPSSWPLYPRLDLLLRGSAPPQPPAPSPLQSPTVNHPLMLLESPPPPPPPQPQSSQASQLPPQSPHPPPPAAAPPPLPPPAAAPLPPPPPLTLGSAQNSHDNGFDRLVKEDGLGGTKVCDGQVSDKNAMETDSSTPALYSDKEKLKSKKMKMRNNDKKKRRRREDWEVSDSIRWLAEVVVRSEQARMDTMREVEKMRAEAEAKRAEMDLKRTEIIANTQLEIARLLSSNGKGVDSSLRIGRS